MLDLSIVVAMARGKVIGNKGELPWNKLPSDLARFRKITLDARTLIMGYNTHVSIIRRNGGPLWGRKHIVMTRRDLKLSNGTVTFVRSPEEALFVAARSGNRACVIGGGEIFRIFLPMWQVNKVYITKVHVRLPGNVTFPAMATAKGFVWKCIDISERKLWDPNDEYETTFEVYKRFRIF